MNLRNFFRALLGIHYLEERILMALNEATLRLESSLALLGTNINDQLTAISAEIQQLATAVANTGGDTADIEARLGAAADKLDALRAQVTDSTASMSADDAPAAPTEGGDTGTDPNAPTA
jgi:septal ring factor EnvC (AmiA/AmiB activator)